MMGPIVKRLRKKKIKNKNNAYCTYSESLNSTRSDRRIYFSTKARIQICFSLLEEDTGRNEQEKKKKCVCISDQKI